ncbi:hypothetical protein ACEPAG_5789 [Sanghuangporus baumii]
MFRRARRREDGNMGMRDTAQRSLTGRPLVIQQRGRNAPHAGGQASRSERIANISAIVIVWSILVVNTELTITRNYSMGMRRFVWGPGQISAMALLVVPVTSLAKVIAVRYRVDWLCYLLVAEEIPHPLRPHANGMDDRQEQGLVSHTTEQESFEGDEANIRSSAFHSDAVTGQQAERNGTEALERMEVILVSSSFHWIKNARTYYKNRTHRGTLPLRNGLSNKNEGLCSPRKGAQDGFLGGSLTEK